jgi:hypothetical protein
MRVLGQIKEKMLKLQNMPSDPKAVELTKTVQIAKSDGAVAEINVLQVLLPCHWHLLVAKVCTSRSKTNCALA